MTTVFEQYHNLRQAGYSPQESADIVNVASQVQIKTASSFQKEAGFFSGLGDVASGIGHMIEHPINWVDQGISHLFNPAIAGGVANVLNYANPVYDVGALTKGVGNALHGVQNIVNLPGEVGQMEKNQRAMQEVMQGGPQAIMKNIGAPGYNYNPTQADTLLEQHGYKIPHWSGPLAGENALQTAWYKSLSPQQVQGLQTQMNTMAPFLSPEQRFIDQNLQFSPQYDANVWKWMQANPGQQMPSQYGPATDMTGFLPQGK
jgi:hypothetical protein